jgi:hypothetical protein
VPLKVVSVILDHSSIAFPGDVYGHVSPDIVQAIFLPASIALGGGVAHGRARLAVPGSPAR